MLQLLLQDNISNFFNYFFYNIRVFFYFDIEFFFRTIIWLVLIVSEANYTFLLYDYGTKFGVDAKSQYRNCTGNST